MAEETPKKSWRKARAEAKIMVEPEEKVMEEVPSLPPEAYEEEVSAPVLSPSTPKSAPKPATKTMLDSHPVAKRKYQSILSQRAVGARKYLRSK